MVLRTLLGDGPPQLVPEHPLAPEQVIIAGERAGDASEHEYIRETGLRHHGVADFEKAFETLTGPVYVHIDLDVLEPTEFGSLGYPEPHGVSPQRLIDLVSCLDNVVGAAITEHMPTGEPADAADAEVIRRLGAALPL